MRLQSYFRGKQFELSTAAQETLFLVTALIVCSHSDEALAKRLQEEEDRRHHTGSPHSGTPPGHRTPYRLPHAPTSRDQSPSVREIMHEQAAADASQRARVSKASPLTCSDVLSCRVF